MSAYIVNDNHINILVSYFVDYRSLYQLWFELNGKFGYMDKDNAAEVAQCLYAENVRSVNSRYNELKPDEGFNFKYIENAKSYSIGQIAGAIDCLEYQSCETDDYHQTDAYKLLLSMRKRLLNQVAEREGVETWELDRPKVAA